MSFKINKCCGDEKFCNDDTILDIQNTIGKTNNLYISTTTPDSKPILFYNYKFQRKSQPGYKRDYNNYYKNY